MSKITHPRDLSPLNIECTASILLCLPRGTNIDATVKLAASAPPAYLAWFLRFFNSLAGGENSPYICQPRPVLPFVTQSASHCQPPALWEMRNATKQCSSSSSSSGKSGSRGSKRVRSCFRQASTRCAVVSGFLVHVVAGGAARWMSGPNGLGAL